jgi:hypothetical protein
MHIADTPYLDVAYTPYLDIAEATNIPQDSFPDVLSQTLRRNTFSEISESSLPLSVPMVHAAATASKSPLLTESVAFAIMGRNKILLNNLLQKMKAEDLREEMCKTHPFHLAATYLDGAKCCCSIFEELVDYLPPRDHYLNDKDHTVLDSLILTILRSHTTCKPGDFDIPLKSDQRFRGEELDICGRWDADSEAFLSLLHSGMREVPNSWKHKLCHTSTQAICHSICILFASSSFAPPDINRKSGLCETTCISCGLRMQLSHLHVILVVALKLSIFGRDNEDLFGVLAVILCLLSNGANPSQAMQVPHSLYQEVDDELDCHHSEYTPAELCQEIINTISIKISPALRTGWGLLHCVLVLSASEWIGGEPDEGWEVPEIPSNVYNFKAEEIEDIESQIPCRYRHNVHGVPSEWDTAMDFCNIYEDREKFRLLARPENFFGHNKDLSTLWAAVQTELLTYRRLHDNATWVSPAFNMANLLDGLQSGSGIQIDIVTESRMSDFCDCGRFVGAENPAIPRADEVSRHYLSNLEDSWRATHIDGALYDVTFCF